MLEIRKGDFISKTDETYFERKVKVAALAVTLVADELLRRFMVSKGLTPFGVFAPIIAARIGVDLAGEQWSQQIDEEEGLENWKQYSNSAFGWWGLETTVMGAPLNLIPNPIGIGGKLFESGVAIGEHLIRDGRPPVTVHPGFY